MCRAQVRERKTERERESKLSCACLLVELLVDSREKLLEEAPRMWLLAARFPVMTSGILMDMIPVSVK